MLDIEPITGNKHGIKSSPFDDIAIPLEKMTIITPIKKANSYLIAVNFYENIPNYNFDCSFHEYLEIDIQGIVGLHNKGISLGESEKYSLRRQDFRLR